MYFPTNLLSTVSFAVEIDILSWISNPIKLTDAQSIIITRTRMDSAARKDKRVRQKCVPSIFEQCITWLICAGLAWKLIIFQSSYTFQLLYYSLYYVLACRFLLSSWIIGALQPFWPQIKLFESGFDAVRWCRHSNSKSIVTFHLQTVTF